MPPPQDHWQWLIPVVIFIGLICLVCAVVGPTEILATTLHPILHPADGTPGWSYALLLVGLHIAVNVAPVPFAVVVCLIPGMVFDFVPAALIVFCGNNLGANLALLLGRSVMKQPLRDWIMSASNPAVFRILRTIEEREDKMVVLLVLWGFLYLPNFIKIYAPCLFDIAYWKIVVCALPGQMWWALWWASFGSVFRSTDEVLQRGNSISDWEHMGTHEVLLFFVTSLATFLISSYAYWFFRTHAMDRPGEASEETPLLTASPGPGPEIERAGAQCAA